MKPAVGVLALQGDSEPHLEMLRRLGVEPLQVRAPEELAACSHLVLPGGESTTIRHLLELFGLLDPLVERFSRGELALFGTCAGAILLAKSAGEKPATLGLLDVEIERNAYGRQIDSFARELDAPALGRKLQGVFIRAPKFVRVGPDVRVLASDGADPVLVEAPGVLAATFHPELSGDPIVHERFLRLSSRRIELAAQRSR